MLENKTWPSAFSAFLLEAQKFVDWVISPAGQGVIASYRINGEQLFFSNAGK